MSKKNKIIRFNNPITGEREYLGVNSISLLINREIEFYTEHSYLLPKGIYIDKRTRKFVVSMQLPKYRGKSKAIYLGSFYTLGEAKRYKMKAIHALLSDYTQTTLPQMY